MPSTPAKSQRSAASRERLARLDAQHQAARRKRLGLGFGITVIVVVVALIVARVAVGHSTKPAAARTSAGTVASQVAAVPPSVINAVGAGSGVTPPTSLSAPPAGSGGKPLVAYVGGEFCPYCAAERWALVQALSRFGTFSNLGQTRSAADDGNIATLDFVGSSYTSDYLVFKGFEVEDGNRKPLQTPSADVAALFARYGNQSFPFVDLGGTSLTGASFSPDVLSGLDQQQIAADLANPKSPVTQAIVGSANAITKRLCALTHGAPTAVCSAAGVTAAE